MEDQMDGSTEIVTREEREPPSLLALIAQAARDPAFDLDKMQALLDMQERIEARQARREYQEAMNLAQAEIGPVARTVKNPDTKSWYAVLEDVDRAIRPIYLRHGFSLAFNTVAPIAAGQLRIECKCAHKSGHFELFHREAPPDTHGPKGTPTKTPLHGGASTETFLKRYLTCGIFNVVFLRHDDDGNAGGAQYISGEQVKEISDLLRETGATLDSFLATFAVEGLPKLPLAAYPAAVNMLAARKRRAQRDGETG